MTLRPFRCASAGPAPCLRVPSRRSGRCFLLGVLGLLLTPARAGDWALCLGPAFRAEVEYGRGHDELVGLQAGISAFAVADHLFQLRASYLTSRLESAFFHRTAEIDQFGLGLTAHLRRKEFFDPMLEVGATFTEANRRPEVVREGWRFEVKPGLSLNFAGGYYGLELGTGWQVPQKRPWPRLFQVVLWKGI